MRSINNNAPIKCSKTATINADSRKVWAVITDINNWPVWQKDISNAKLNGELKPSTSFEWKSNGAKIHSVLHTVEPYTQFGWWGKSFGMLAIHNWKLTEKDGKTEVAVEESMEGLLGKFFKKSLNKNLQQGMQSWLYLLKKECEN